MRTLRLLVWLIFIPVPWLYAQHALLDQQIRLEKTSGTMQDILQELSHKGGFGFSYSNRLPLQKQVTLQRDQQSLRAHLAEILAGEPVEYLVRKNKILLRNKPGTQTAESAIGRVTLSGYVRDSTSGEVLIGASIYIAELATGISTNTYGFYSVTVPPASYTLAVTHLGYRPSTQTISLIHDQQKDIALPAVSQQLDEVVVSAGAAANNVASLQMSTHQLDSKTIRQMPALAGEADVLKSIQLLPGVTTVGEGSTGFFVRGGNSDQNLILLDEAPVYNPSHFLGFLSVFNTDAIKEASLYKGGIPARYGGRASSVLAIHLKEGDQKRFRATGGAGFLGGARLSVEAPLQGGKGSFILSGRRTFAEPLFWLGAAVDSTLKGTNVYFYDFNAKVNYTFNQKNKVYLSGYFGRDMNRLPFLDYQINWGNTTGTFRLNHLFNQRLFSNFTLLYSQYRYQLNTPAAEVPFSWQSGITDGSAKADFTFFASPHTTITFGLHSIYHWFNPGRNGVRAPASQALEHAVYAGVERKLGDRIVLEYGLRYSLFQNVGKALVYRYNKAYQPIDSSAYAAGKLYHTHGGLEPRLNVRFQINEQQSIKASYNRLNQYLHLLSNSSLSFTAFDVWYQSGPNLQPVRADQLALSYFRNVGNKGWEASIEGYYKTIANQVDYRDHAQITFNPYLEAELRTGKGWAYGVEFFLRKPSGKLTGWINYTYSRVWRQIPEINRGNAYPAIYDQPHKISLTAAYEASKKVSLGLNWVYNTGGAINLPLESFAYENQSVPVYGGRNESRLPNYHRLDLSATVRQKTKPGRKWEGRWVYSITNVYARKNPLGLYVGEDLSMSRHRNNPRIVANQVYLFSIIPSVSYLFTF